MAITERVPLMASGATIRNLVVGGLYFVLLPLWLGILPFVAGIFVFGNFHGWAEKLAKLPGITPTGGVKAGGVAFLYVFLALGLFGAAFGGGGDTGGQQAAAGGGAGGESLGTATPVSIPSASTETAVETSIAAGARTRTTTPVETAAETPVVTVVDTRTPTPVSPQTPVTTPTPTPTPTPDRNERTEFTVTIIEIVDGDTMDIRYKNGDTDTIRLLGVDTPEVHTQTDPAEWEGIPGSDTGRDHLRDWGHKASEYSRTELKQGEEIRIVVDVEADRRGGYDRLLVYVYDDGDLFNRELLDQGYARLYDTEFSKRSQFETAELDARDGEIGVWDFDDPTPTSTPEPDQSGDGLVVDEIHADAEGNDHENLNDEYIVFENTGSESLDLSGWTVSDEADHTYSVPDGFELDPGARVTLYTGSGDDTDSELYWGQGSAVWNNGGDTIYVTNEDGETVIERSYD